jgi:hypothetical protein
MEVKNINHCQFTFWPTLVVKCVCSVHSLRIDFVRIWGIFSSFCQLILCVDGYINLMWFQLTSFLIPYVVTLNRSMTGQWFQKAVEGSGSDVCYLLCGVGLLTRPAKFYVVIDNQQVQLSVAGLTVSCETKDTEKSAFTFMTEVPKKAFNGVVKRLCHLDIKRWPKNVGQWKVCQGGLMIKPYAQFLNLAEAPVAWNWPVTSSSAEINPLKTKRICFI